MGFLSIFILKKDLRRNSHDMGLNGEFTNLMSEQVTDYVT